MRLHPSAVLLPSLLLVGCGDDGTLSEPVEREYLAADAPQAAGQAERLAPGLPTEAAGRGLPIAAPEGWSELPPRAFQAALWAVPGGAECSLAFTRGSGAEAVAANVDRWRREFALDPLSPTDQAALPRRPWLGGEAVLVQLEGRFQGMGGPAIDAAAVRGLIVDLPDGQIATLKLSGPTAAVTAATAAFDSLIEGLERMPR